jgi:hypothetical protein
MIILKYKMNNFNINVRAINIKDFKQSIFNIKTKINIMITIKKLIWINNKRKNS